jgi:hypothetical protein
MPDLDIIQSAFFYQDPHKTECCFGEELKKGCLKSLLKHLTTEKTEIKQRSQRFDTKKVTSLRTL